MIAAMVVVAMGMRVVSGGRQEKKCAKHTNSYANYKSLFLEKLFLVSNLLILTSSSDKSVSCFYLIVIVVPYVCRNRVNISKILICAI